VSVRLAAMLALGAIGSVAAVPAYAAEEPEAARILAEMHKVADWAQARIAEHRAERDKAGSRWNPRDWQQATFWIGMTALAEQSAEPGPREAILALGRDVGRRLGDRRYHGDDHLIGATWLWAAEHGAGPEALAPLRATFDAILAEPRTNGLAFPEQEGQPGCTDRWCWCDALFMAPPTWFGLTRATGDPRYADFADREFRATVAYLYDPAEHLFFRDSRFFDRRDDQGRKLFWSRGNGWVLAGLARTIPLIAEDDPRRAFYVDLYRDMAAHVVALQRPNGYWPPSLLDDSDTAPPESSGTGLFTFALAWGVNAGLLPRERYAPAVRRGWAALERAVAPGGRMGWVQQVSDRPDDVAEADTQLYGAGAFLLAGSEVLRMEKAR